jgi:hypothetical protein
MVFSLPYRGSSMDGKSRKERTPPLDGNVSPPLKASSMDFRAGKCIP